MAKLGDMICTTPVFRSIKKSDPDYKVYVLGNKINKDLLENSDLIDGYIVFNDIFDSIKKIRAISFDFAIMTGPSFINLGILSLSNIGKIISPAVINGFSPYQDIYYKILSVLSIKIPHKMGSYVPREYLRLLEPLGIYTENTKKYLDFSEDADLFVDNLLESNGLDLKEDLIVGISPSAGNKIKQWPEDRFAEVADYINQKYGGKIIVIGGPNDEKEVSNMIRHISSDTKYVNVQGRLNIDQLKALVSKLSLFISVDTGPIYIAEAFGIPTIDIVGPMDENEQPPVGDMHKVIVSKRIKPELHIMNARIYDYKEALRQVFDTEISFVLSGIDDLINENEKNN